MPQLDSTAALLFLSFLLETELHLLLLTFWGSTALRGRAWRGWGWAQQGPTKKGLAASTCPRRSFGGKVRWKRAKNLWCFLFHFHINFHFVYVAIFLLSNSKTSAVRTENPRKNRCQPAAKVGETCSKPSPWSTPPPARDLATRPLPPLVVLASAHAAISR